MRKVQLRDLEKWKKLNKEGDFSAFDYIFHIVKEKKINTDLFFAFLELFWPEFIKNNKYVFLKENFSVEKFDQTINSEAGPEYWVNLLMVDGFFSEEDDDREEKAASLAKVLVEMWKAKLKKDFPSMDFVVKYQHDKECGEYGLTFYQTKGNALTPKQA